MSVDPLRLEHARAVGHGHGRNTPGGILFERDPGVQRAVVNELAAKARDQVGRAATLGSVGQPVARAREHDIGATAVIGAGEGA